MSMHHSASRFKRLLLATPVRSPLMPMAFANVVPTLPPNGLQFALWLASLDINVFPLNPTTKKPFSNADVALTIGKPCPPDGDGGCKLATTDVASITAWWTCWPDALIGIRTGSASGLYVLDIDRKNDKDGFAVINANNWHIPQTAACWTPSGGAHHYFRIPRNDNRRWKTDAGRLGAGVDRKGDGGYVVWYGADLSQPMAEPPMWMTTDIQSGPSPQDNIVPLGTRRATSFDHPQKALYSIDPNELSYPEWRDITFAFRQSATGLADDFVIRTVWDGWNAQYRANDKAANEKLWRSADNGTAFGWKHLLDNASDHVRAELMFGATPTFTAPPSPCTPALPNGRLLIPVDELLQQPRQHNWLVRGIIPGNAAGVMYGAPGTGKTFVAIDIACSVAAGTPFDKKKVQAGPVVYVAGEGHNAIRDRFDAWFTHRNIGEGKRNIHVSRTSVSFVDQSQFSRLISEIDAMPIKPKLVVIDTLFRATAGADVNDAREMSGFWANIDNIKNRLGCTVLIVHHSGRNEQGRSFGSIVHLANADFEISITKKDRGVGVIENTKQKDAKEFEPLHFTLKQIHLGHHIDPDTGEPEHISSCVCDYVQLQDNSHQDRETIANIQEHAPPAPPRETSRQMGGLICKVYDKILQHRGIALTDTIYSEITIPNGLLRKLASTHHVKSYDYRNGLDGLTGKSAKKPHPWITMNDDGSVTPKSNLLRWARDDHYCDFDNLELADADYHTIMNGTKLN